MTNVEALERVKRFMQNYVTPRANEIDRNVHAVREALQGMCTLDLMALKRPAAYGGPELTEAQFREFQEDSARASGTFAFLQTQHQSAVAMIAGSTNDALKQSYLPKMGNGEKLVAIGFSQLRRSGKPVLRADTRPGGYRLNGQAPWVTGFGFFHEVLVGASLLDGRAVFGLVPLADTERDGGCIQVGDVMEVASMQSAQTVPMTFRDWWLPEEQVAFFKPPNWIHESDMLNVQHAGFALGCAQAAIDVILKAAERRESTFAQQAGELLQRELDECRRRIYEASDAAAPFGERVELRAWAIDLAARTAHAAVAASAGAGNSLKHPAQRIYREALVFSVSAQTTAIMERTLKRLVRRGGL